MPISPETTSSTIIAAWDGKHKTKPMKEDYLVPEYYPKFACKMGACRHPCCVGWPISVSTDDYFRLLGVDCAPALRAKLDTAVRVSLHPTPEAYAQIAPTWEGDCPLHMKDGRCSVQAELGAEVLPTICRLYPRGIRMEDGNECSCANSCEAVAELLLTYKEPLRFIRYGMDVCAPKAVKREFFFETVGRASDIRMYLIALVQDRAYAMPQRLMRLGEALSRLEKALAKKDEAQVDALLSGAPLHPQRIPEERNLPFALDVVCRMLEQIDERSGSIREHGRAALALLGGEGNRAARYREAEEHLNDVMPEHGIVMEHVLVNHMFFEQFPFQDRDEGLCDEFIAICAVYALIRVLCVCAMAEQTDTTAFMDAIAATFRLIDHTAFDRYGAHLLKELGCADGVSLAKLVTV